MKQIKITQRLTNRSVDSFNQYLMDIREIDMLTIEEEIELTQKTAMGDKAAINELVSRNLRFVVSVAKKYETANLPIGDLVNEGNIGLIKAAEKFDPSLNIRFISYAVWWVRKIILEYISNHTRIIRLPMNRLNEMSKLDQKITELEQKLGRTIDAHEFVSVFENEFEGDKHEVLDLLTVGSVDSLDREIGGVGEETSKLSDLLSDPSAKSTDHLMLNSDLKSEIARLLAYLKPRDKRIMIDLYGLSGEYPMSLKEVSEREGISREMVRQVKEKSLKKLKILLRNSALKECL